MIPPPVIKICEWGPWAIASKLQLPSRSYFNPILHGLFQAGSTRGGGIKCPRPFSLKRLKLLQSNLVHVKNFDKVQNTWSPSWISKHGIAQYL